MNEILDRDFTINDLMHKMRVNPVANNGKGRSFSCESGDILYYRIWKSTNQNKIVVAIHGMGAHSEYYIQVADQLIENGISVYALDVKHHGLSSGKKGDLAKFEEILYQIHEFITKIRGDNNNIPIFLMGLSMGGMITINYSVMYQDDLNGIILMAPGVKSNFKLTALDFAKLPLLMFAFLFARSKPIVNIASRAGITSRNPVRLEYQDHDPLRVTKMSPRFLMQMGKWLKRANKNAENITVPTIFFQGTDDKLVSPGGVRNFYERLTISDKTFIEINGGYHSLFSDPGMVDEKGWDLLRSWILSHS